MADAAREQAKAELDERKLARAIALWLPVATIAAASVAGVFIGFPMAILTLAAGVMLGVIAILWASIRVLSGDATLPPEIEALDRSQHSGDALLSRKRMLLRALKDLDAERDLGKLEEADHRQISETYRNELKEVMRLMDEALSPFRERAEWEANAYLQTQGLGEGGYRGPNPPPAEAGKEPKEESKAVRLACPKCETSNETDAAFCKKCGTSLGENAEKTAEKAETEDAS